MRIAFTRWRSRGLFNRPSPRKRLLPKKKTSSAFEFVSGLADGASAMPAKWSRPAFSFRFYEGKISRALQVPLRQARSRGRRHPPCPQKIDDGGSTEGRRKRDPIGLRSEAATQAVYFFAAGRRRCMNRGGDALD